MSSSQDSDIDLECDRIIKLKRLTPKFFKSILIEQLSTESEQSKIKSKQLKTDPSFDDKTNGSNQQRRLLRRTPVNLTMQNKQSDQNNRGVKFFVEDSCGVSQNIITQTSLASPRNKRKSPPRLKYLQDQQKYEQTVQMIDSIGHCNFKKKNLLSSYNNSEVAQNNAHETRQNNLREKTTPIPYGRGRTQIIKEYIKEGNKIRTNWQKGLIHGYTQIDYHDRGKFRGIFHQGDMISGQITFSNGFVYTGEFSMFTFHGVGKLKFPSGQIFEGNWLLGSLQGNGKIVYPKGQIYYGEISNFKRDGQGYLYFSNGHKYVGQFSKGQITGFGEFHKNGELSDKGFWVDGYFVGQKVQNFKKRKQQNEIAKKNNRKSQQDLGKSLHQSLKDLKEKHSFKFLNFGKIEKQFSSNSVQNSFLDIKQQLRSSPTLRIKKQISLSMKMI